MLAVVVVVEGGAVTLVNNALLFEALNLRVIVPNATQHPEGEHHIVEHSDVPRPVVQLLVALGVAAHGDVLHGPRLDELTNIVDRLAVMAPPAPNVHVAGPGSPSPGLREIDRDAVLAPPAVAETYCLQHRTA